MNILITAGSTHVFIDRVRSITNRATGRTGAALALKAYHRGHRVTLLTSHPQTMRELIGENGLPAEVWRQRIFQTLEDLRQAMEQELGEEKYDAVVHSAAISDYLAAGVFAPSSGTRFSEEYTWHASAGEVPTLVDRADGKIRSDEAELWLRLVRAPKLVDMVRADWGFRGILVKFKLEVALDDEQLLEIAEKSRTHSQADLMVANSLEGAASWAYLGPCAGAYEKVVRADLPTKLMEAVEKLRNAR